MARFDVPYDGPPYGYANRGLSKIYVAIHNTSNNASPHDEAEYAKHRSDKTSSHFYADDKTVIQSLDTKYDANHAGNHWGNGKAIAFELVGTNGSSVDHWKAVIDRVAPVVAAVMKYYGIANRHLTVGQMQALNVSGIVTHNDMRLAWGGTTHDDPGPNFPMSYLIAQVGKYLNPAAPTKDFKTVDINVSFPLIGEGNSDDQLPGYKIIYRIQRLVGATVDGNWGPKTTAAIQSETGIKPANKLTEELYRKIFGLGR